VSSLHQGFQQTGESGGQTGESGGTEAVFGWLDGADESPLIQQVKRRMLEVCPVGQGDQVLDVGCGLGHEVCRLAKLVGPQGRVAGIDANPAMITEARRRGAGLALPIGFEVGDAHQVSSPDDSFDLCRTERVLRLCGQATGSAGGDGAPDASWRIGAGL
jgi:ubiquinone/menaquinone biosynthesis C-methylase UbiE